MNNAANRRLHRRQVLRTTARVELPGAPARDVQTWDIGLDGMSLISPRPIAPGSRCTVALELPGSAAESACLRLAARSVYCSLMGAEGFKVGLVFGDLDVETQRVIAAFAR